MVAKILSDFFLYSINNGSLAQKRSQADFYERPHLWHLLAAFEVYATNNN